MLETFRNAWKVEELRKKIINLAEIRLTKNSYIKCYIVTFVFNHKSYCSLD